MTHDDERLMTADEVVAYVIERGRRMTRDGWYAHVSRRQAPKAGRYVGRTPQWSVAQIDEWLAARPRKPRGAEAATGGQR